MQSIVAINERKAERRKYIRIWLRIMSYINKYGWLLALGVILLATTVMTNIGIAAVTKKLINFLTAGEMDKLFYNVKLYAAIFTGAAVATVIGSFIVYYVQQLIRRDISNEVFKHINNIPFPQVQHEKTGDLVRRVTTDVDLVANVIGIWTNLINNFLTFVIALLYLSNIDFKLALLATSTGPITLLAGRFFDRKMRLLSKTAGDKGGIVQSALQETLQQMPVARVLRLEKMLQKRFEMLRSEEIYCEKKNILLSIIMQYTSKFVNTAANLILTFIICLSAINGHLEIGAVLAFIMLLSRLQWPFTNMSNSWGEIQKRFGAAERIFAILDIEPENTGSADNKEHIGANDSSFAITFENVEFAYEEKEEDKKPFFKDFTFRVSKGEFVAIVGASGSGKSTIAKLCCGLYLPDKGDIRILGQSTKDSIKYIRQNISYVSQSPYLFTGTVGENIALGASTVSFEDIVNAAVQANVDEFISKTEKGYESIVGEYGWNLSGGQRQRISIARAMVRKAPIVILDEATSSLDNKSEVLIQKSLSSLAKDRTLLVIAHRLSTVRDADRIIVLEKGRIVEEGNHNELMQNNGAYAKLYELQL